MMTKGSSNQEPVSTAYDQSPDHMSFSTESFYNSDSSFTSSSSEQERMPSANSVAMPLEYRMNPYQDQSLQRIDPGYIYNPNQLNRILPQASRYSLHFPLQRCQDKVLKILRFVETECEVMPSRDRVPYLVIAELIEQPFQCRSSELYNYEPEAPTAKVTPTLLNAEAVPQLANFVTRSLDETASSSVNNGNDGNYVIDKHMEVRAGNNQNDWYRSNNHNHYDSSPRQGSYDGFGYQTPSSYAAQSTVQSSYQSASPQPYQHITFTRSQTWAEKKDMIRATSPFGHLPGWTIKSFLVKSGDDLRKEMLAMQLIEYLQNIFRLEGVDVHLRPYQIMSTGYQAGLVEFLNGAKSIDRIKKSASSNPSTLKDYFDFSFGPSYSLFHATAVENFVKSLAGYSLVTYALQVKDRHNANLLIDPEGHIIHIDYGFILGDSPGFNLNFENAPFKLTKEYLEVMGGIDSYAFKLFEDLFVRGFFAIQKHIDGLVTIIQVSFFIVSQAIAYDDVVT
jgi:hypothetical protein